MVVVFPLSSGQVDFHLTTGDHEEMFNILSLFQDGGSGRKAEGLQLAGDFQAVDDGKDGQSIWQQFR